MTSVDSKNPKKQPPLGWNSPTQHPMYPTQPTYPTQPGYPVGVTTTPYMQNQVPYTISTSRASTTPVYEPGLPNQPYNEDPEAQKNKANMDNFGTTFSSREIRHRFVRKVYAMVTFQLAVTLATVAVFTLHQDVKAFVQRNSWICYLSYAVFIVTYITLICCKGVRRTWPANIILLSIFTLAMSYLMGAIASFHKTEIVLLSVGITAVICFLITMFAIQTKIDFTGWAIYLFVASCILFLFGIMAIFMHNRVMNLLYSGGIVLLFSMYLIFDTQSIIGGRKHQLSAEEHITASLLLYIDVVYIFLGILGLSRS